MSFLPSWTELLHQCSTPRDVDVVNKVSIKDNYASEGCLIDVYDNFIIVNGMNLIASKPIALGTYKIDTPLQTVDAGTFVDSTGTIVTS